MNSRSAAAPRRAAITLIIAGLIVVALAAFGGRDVSGAPLPSGPPSAASSRPPTADPTTEPSPAPTDGDAMPIRVDIETINGEDVHVDIVDGTGTVIGARSEPAAEGASVDRYALEVENVDARTLRLTWVDYPIANALALYLIPNDGVIHLVLIQPEPTGPTDSIVSDRGMLLEFSEPISAEDVVATLQDGLDTPGWAGYEG